MILDNKSKLSQSVEASFLENIFFEYGILPILIKVQTISWQMDESILEYHEYPRANAIVVVWVDCDTNTKQGNLNIYRMKICIVLWFIACTSVVVKSFNNLKESPSRLVLPLRRKVANSSLLITSIIITSSQSQFYGYRDEFTARLSVFVCVVTVVSQIMWNNQHFYFQPMKILETSLEKYFFCKQEITSTTPSR